MIVKQEFQEGIYITTFGLKSLRHRHADDFALVDLREIKRAWLLAAEDFRDFRRDEVLKKVPDGLPDTTQLFGRLVGHATVKVLHQRGSLWSFKQLSEHFTCGGEVRLTR